MPSRTVDYIIAGQGLAGSCVAIQLMRRGKKIIVIDKPDEKAASVVAAGLFNPVTGRKMTKTWLADLIFPYLHDFYPLIERITGHSFFYPLPVYRPFLSFEEQNEWMAKSADPAYRNFIREIKTQSGFNGEVHDPYGGLLLGGSGYLNTIQFLNAVRQHLLSKDSFIEEWFDEGQLSFAGPTVQYKSFEADRIIFCTGTRVNNSKYTSWLPVSPLKGEIMTIANPGTRSDVIYNRGVFLVPGLWKVGSTYTQDHSEGVTDAGVHELNEKLRDLLTSSITPVSYTWGWRPTSPDRRPLIGAHPEIPSVIIFNGLGTKGVSLAPYFSDNLANWLENGLPLNNQVAVSRYYSLYWKSA